MASCYGYLWRWTTAVSLRFHVQYSNICWDSEESLSVAIRNFSVAIKDFSVAINDFSVATRTFQLLQGLFSCYKGLFSCYKGFCNCYNGLSSWYEGLFSCYKGLSSCYKDFSVAIKDLSVAYNQGTTKHKTIYDPTAQCSASVWTCISFASINYWDSFPIFFSQNRFIFFRLSEGYFGLRNLEEPAVFPWYQQKNHNIRSIHILHIFM